MQRNALVALVALLLARTSPVAAQVWGPSGPEFQVNTYTTGTQYGSAIASDWADGFLVSWVSIDEDGDANGIYARRFNVKGPIGGEFLVNTTTAGSQRHPAAAGTTGPSFLVAWETPDDGDAFGIFGQSAGASGLVGSEFRVNAATTSSQFSPAIGASLFGGVFVAAWSGAIDISGGAVAAQRFNGAGPLGSEFRVNTYWTGVQDYPSVGVNRFGQFVVAWTSITADGPEKSVFAQRFDSDGSPLGPEFRVNTTFGVTQGKPAVAVGDSSFVVAWHKVVEAINDADIHAQRFSLSGEPGGAEFRVNTYTSAYQWLAKAAMDLNGGFVILWEDRGGADGSAFGAMARRYSGSGSPIGGELAVSAGTAGDQRSPSVAMNVAGDFVVSYTVNVAGSAEIRARVFCAALAGDADGNATINVADVLYLINNLFAGGPAPVSNADADGSGAVNVSDVLYLINTLFAGGPPPSCPSNFT